jgi:3D (Asp-Asp-Asp) domain-containing protein
MENRDYISGRYIRKNRGKKIAKGIFQLLIAGALLAGLFYASDYAIRKQEVIDCEKYARWYGEYKLFQIEPETRIQCEAVGVDMPGEKMIVPDREYEEITATIYAYNSLPEQTDEDPTITASGKIAYEGSIACPSRYEFGTRVEYAGKFYTCEDRMNKRYRDGNYFDIWMADSVDAVNFGVKKNETIKIYK